MGNNVDSTLASAKALEVDVGHLENISRFLNSVADAVKTIRDSTLHQAHSLATVGGELQGGGTSTSALGSEQLREARDLAVRENGTFQAVDGALKAMTEDLRKTAEGITKIAEQYDSIEERNAITAAEWTRAISG